MTGSLLIKNGTVVSAEGACRADVAVQDGRVAWIGSRPDFRPDRVFDAAGCAVGLALADVHVHLREPGNPEKETIATGTAAAARGGYTVVCAMPNLDPVPDSLQTLGVEQAIIERDARIDVRPYASITLGRAGRELVDFAALKDRCAAFSDDGSGVQDDAVMEEAMRRVAACGGILAAHCEDNSYLGGRYVDIPAESEWKQVERDLVLAERTGCHYHVCHISTKESVRLIRAAKARGVRVTCETAPHYLLLTAAGRRDEGRFKMNPPLRDEEDREALVEGLLDGTIDMIATDHAPHTVEQKSRGLEGSAMGIVGLETAFPLLYTGLVLPGILSLEKLWDLMSGSPRRVFGLGGALAPGAPADIAVFDLERAYAIDSASFASKGKSTPFEGWTVRGGCILTIFNGKTVYAQD